MAQHDADEAMLDRLHRRLRTLSRCTTTLFQAESEQEVLQSLCDILVDGGEARLAWIGYCEDDGEQTIRPVAHAGSGLDYLERVKTSWGEPYAGQSPAGIAVRTGRAYRVDDIRSTATVSWRAAALERGFASCIAVPLIARGTRRGPIDLRGMLNLYSTECNAFDESAIEHYTALATSVAYAVTALRVHLADDLASGVTALRARAERKRSEEALHQAREELARVARVTTLGELAASIAHEVNQPLAAIVADATACLNWLQADRPPLDNIREALAGVVSDSNRAGEVIARIRALVARSSVAHQPCDLGGVVRDVLLLVGPGLGRHGTVLQTALAADLPRVMGDRVQLQQVLLNLILNAGEAVRDVAPERRRVLVRSSLEHRDDGRWAVVAVEDAGIGFREEQAARLFEAFYTTKADGLGMGLSISRSIIDQHRGRLWATAKPGQGATFHVALPAVP
jgi:C4-dicarboxylate-specific signal transduction histidine kinase